MKFTVFIVALSLLPMVGARAQTPDQRERGLGSTAMFLMQEVVSLRTQAAMLQDEVAACKAVKVENPAPKAGQ